MARIWPVLAIAAAAVVAVVLLLGGKDDGATPYGDEDIVGYDERGNPILLTSDGERRPRRPPPPPPPQETEEEAAARRLAERRLFLRGVVVAVDGGTPLPGARLWAEPAVQPCPRLPRPGWSTRFFGPVALDPPNVTTGQDGRFEWRVRPAALAEPERYDVFVTAAGHVAAVLCTPAAGSDVTVRLQKALQMPVQVTDRHGRPIEAAALTVFPAEGTEAVPGHGGQGVSDRDGRAEIDGLLPGDVMLTADHPEYMPQTIGPLDPATATDVQVKLAPALRLAFEIRSDDGSEIKNPTLAWQTDGRPPHSGLTLLKATASGPPAAPLSEVRTAPVRIPCDHRNVKFELKADGFEPWAPEREPLPADGDERTKIVSLTRDTSLASLRVRFEDAQGEVVHYGGMRPVPDITRLDGVAIPSGIVLQGGETLFFPALPAGPYRIGVRSPKHAPAEADVTVVAGEENEVTIRVGPPAKLRVRFTAPERLVVRFRLMQAGQIVPAFPEGGFYRDDADGTRPLVAPGNEGAVFSGLPAGSVVVEVTSPELVAAPRTVQLRAGETVEVEIDVQPR